MGSWFVYRSHYEGPLSKRVRRLAAPSILAWFQARFAAALAAEDPDAVAEEELGGYVYGLGSLFHAVHEHRLPAPRTIAELREILDEHLYVEGELVLDEHSLRVSTDDDEVALAYYFFDDHAARDAARVAYLLHTEPALPDGAGAAAFTPPVPIARELPAAGGDGTTYAVLLTFSDSDSIPGMVTSFPGVRLPELARHLREVVPASQPASWSPDYLETWPLELRLLRAMVDAGDRDLAPALARCATYPTMKVASTLNHTRLAVGDHAAARAELDQAAAQLTKDGDPARAIIQVVAHAALLCDHATSSFGFQQWFLFDDRWAAAHPALATAILRYGAHWDPFG